MVKQCVICGNVDGDNNVSVHRIPTDVRRLQWVEFVVNQGFPVNLRSKLCSRHFIPGLDYNEGDVQRRRLLYTAVPSLRLLVEDSVEGRHYRNNIRRYNNTLEFAAFSTNLNTRRLPGRGPNVFTVHGQGYWTISNDLIGNDPILRRYCQLYFVESGETNRIRRKQQQLLPAVHRLLPSVLEDLDGLLRDINPFAQAFE